MAEAEAGPNDVICAAGSIFVSALEREGEMQLAVSANAVEDGEAEREHQPQAEAVGLGDQEDATRRVAVSVVLTCGGEHGT